MNKVWVWSLIVWIPMLLVSCGGGGGVKPGGLVRIITLDEGDATCPNGGVRVSSGLDQDGDGFLTTAVDSGLDASTAEEDTESVQFVCNGSQGSQGTLINVTAESIGDNCQTGGQRVDSFVDANNNGTQDTDEPVTTTYICNGEVQAISEISLLVLTDEPKGTNCTEGGRKIEYGLDLNGNGMLEMDEIASTGFVYNQEGVNPLIAVTDEAEGANCAFGGQRLDVGVDANNDDVLDADEISLTEYICRESDEAVRVTDADWDPYQCLRGGVKVETGLDADNSGALDDNEVELVQFVCAEYPLFPLQIVTGARHSCALMSNHTVQCWGDNNNGQLGDGTTTQRTSPVAVRGIEFVEQLDAGVEHTCARTKTGELYCWGSNNFGQLGAGSTVSVANEPTLITAVSNVTDIATGRFHTCVTSGGTVRCVGNNRYGQLGDGNTTAGNANHTFVTVSGLSDVIDLTAGDRHTCALSGTNVQCWGNNDNGQLGDGTTTSQATPVQVIGLNATTTLVAGGEHTCAIGASERVNCWGDNTHGQLGDGSTVDRSTPVDVNSIANTYAIGAGSRHACSVATVAQGADAFCWGSNADGQLGNGASGTDEVNPVNVDRPGISDEVLSISGGGGFDSYNFDSSNFLIESGVTAIAHTCAIASDGKAYCWGNNTFGQLGTGAASNAPTEVPLILDP